MDLEKNFFSISPIRALISAFVCFASHSHRCFRCFYPNSNAATGNQTQVGSVAPL